MSLSQKDAVNTYIVHTDTKGYSPFTMSYRPQASTKSTDAKRIKELEQEKVKLESIIKEKTTSYNSELAELKKNIEEKKAIYYNQQMSDEIRFREEKTQLETQLREKQKASDNLAARIAVLSCDVDQYLSGRLDKKELENTNTLVKKLEMNISSFSAYLYQIEKVRKALRASREQ